MERLKRLILVKNCFYCGGCIAVCEFGAILKVFPALEFDQNKCKYCLFCVKVCPNQSLKFE